MLEVIVDLSEVIENGNAIDKAIVEQLSDVLLILFSLKPIAYNIGVLTDLPFGIQAPNQRNVKG
jgi:hypothetical protein